ncbi:MAG: nodulation protein NfeD [Archaeoglobaceae archaeon]|nr:nodulation protein NfeD [Archaeoglobaceae archaeon]MDW8127601.1 nodulation protein NfeD [Archaeoglobaceae archaeon]
MRLAFLLLIFFMLKASGFEIGVVSIKGEITEGTYIMLDNAYKKAKEKDLDLLLVEIDTPGGILSSTQKIVSLFMNSEIPIVVYVGKGSMCASAGTVILLSAHIAGMANGTAIGAATPVTTAGTAAENKTINYIASYVKDLASARGRNPEIAEKFVTEALSLTAKEAYELDVVDVLADNRDELIAKINGMKIAVGGKEIVLNTTRYTIVEIEKPFQAVLYDMISNPQIAVILLLLGVYLLIFGLTSPGMMAEVIGAILLILAFAGLGVLNINYAGIFLIILGILFLIAELLTPTYGALAIASVISMTLGILMIFEEPMMPKEFYEFFPKFALGIGIGIASFMTFVLIKIIKVKRKRSSVGEVIGIRGEVVEFENGKGFAKVRGEIWRIESKDDLKVGDEIIVLERDGLNLRVKKFEGTERGDGEVAKETESKA